VEPAKWQPNRETRCSAYYHRQL